MKHTKGNWKLNKDYTIRGEKGQFIAQICSADNNDSEREANARLIAVAPELLEALELICNTNSFNLWTAHQQKSIKRELIY